MHALLLASGYYLKVDFCGRGTRAWPVRRHAVTSVKVNWERSDESGSLQ